jgi:hypothetical protein
LAAGQTIARVILDGHVCRAVSPNDGSIWRITDGASRRESSPWRPVQPVSQPFPTALFFRLNALAQALKTQSFSRNWRSAVLLETGHAALSYEIRAKVRI